ncbi:MAG TPA: glycosyltransferase 87 family protein [Vicinamibacterales bacterium]|nr:glycosyltransferase 87 family protein [Vicinamibacterales bacterium]
MLRLPTPIVMLLIVVGTVRVAVVTWSAIDRSRGDFYASMPGAYVETFNPALWNSPDMTAAWGYHRETYFHGPTQYLTLYPLALFDSFASIALVLLPLYGALLAAAFFLLWRVAKRLGGTADVFAPLFAATFLFLPLLQAYLQREFEVVVLAALSAALLLLLNDRRGAAAGLLAYVAWFKYIPVLYAGYLLLRRWWRELAVFAAVSIAVLILSEALFGLWRFFNNNVPAHAAQAFTVWGSDFRIDATGHLYGTGFCDGWIDTQTSLANVRHGLCTLASRHAWIHPPLIYLGLCLSIAVFYLRTQLLLDRRTAPALEERRRAIEFSIVTTVCACFVFGHYYYLTVLIIPFNVLLVMYWREGRVRSVALWAIAYALVGAFVVPIGVLSRISGYDVWALFIRHSLFLYGELLLMGLLLNEYRRLAVVARV